MLEKFAMRSYCLKSKIKVINNIQKESGFQIQKGKVIISFDECFEVTITDLNFKGFLKTYNITWSDIRVVEDSPKYIRNQLSDSGLDTIF